MSKNYTQLSLEQRYKMDALLKVERNQKEIALQLSVSPSTICRELKRNVAKRGRTAGKYLAENAQRKTKLRHQTKPKRIKFTESLKKQVVQQLTIDKWSPELIYQHAKLNQKEMVSHEIIYQWIWSCKHGNRRKERQYKKLYEHLRHGRRRRKRGSRKDSRGTIPNRTPIDQRPAIVAKRKRPGDMEVDLMMGSHHKGALLVMTDRATLHTRLRKLKSKESNGVSKGIIKSLSKSNFTIHTLTFDNDKAFTQHERIGNQLQSNTYFTRPYTSQDKGTVENRIGVLRRFFPKKTDLRFVTARQVKQVEQKLNNRPIRKFKYLTPNQVLRKKIALIT